MSDSLIHSINQYGSFGKKEVDALLDRVIQKSVVKGGLILEQGEICRNLSFLLKGSFRQYHQNQELDEVIVNLFVENDWVLNHQSFTSQKPSTHKIEAFEDSEILIINIHQLHELIGLYPSFFALGKMLESSNPYDLKTPEEKYIHLLETRPDFIQKFPLKYIASYLRMTPETLSRVRNKIR